MQKLRHYLYTEVLPERILLEDMEASAIQQAFHRLEAGLSGEVKLKQTPSDYFFNTNHRLLCNFECVNENGFSH